MPQNPASPAPQPLPPDVQSWQPTSSRYQDLAQQAAQAMQSFAAGEIDFRAFRERTDQIRAQTRALDLLHRLARASQRLAAQEQDRPRGSSKPSPRPVSC